MVARSVSITLGYDPITHLTMPPTDKSSGAVNAENVIQDGAPLAHAQRALTPRDAHDASVSAQADLPWLLPFSDDKNLTRLLRHLRRRLRRPSNKTPLTPAEQACCDVWNFEQATLADGFLHWFDDGDYMNRCAADGRRFPIYLRDALVMAGLFTVAGLLADAVRIRATATARIEDGEVAWDEDAIETAEAWERAQLFDLDDAHLALAARTREQLGRFGQAIDAA